LVFPIMVYGVYIAGLNGAVWGLMVCSVIGCVINGIGLRLVAIKNQVPLAITGCFKEYKTLVKFSLPAALGAALVGPVNWICNAILINQSGGYVELGIYHAANQWFAALLFIPVALSQVFLPVLSDKMGGNNNVQSKKIIILSIKINATIVLPIIIIGSLLSPYIMSLYGNNFTDGWPTLVITFITAGIVAVLVPVGNIIVATGRMWLGFFMNMGWAIVFVITTFILIEYGSIGLAIGKGVGYLFHAIWVSTFVYYFFKCHRVDD